MVIDSIIRNMVIFGMVIFYGDKYLIFRFVVRIVLSLGNGGCVFKFRKFRVFILIMVIDKVRVFCMISILIMLGKIE